MGRGLYADIHAKRKRGEKMRKTGCKGAPSAAQFARAAQTSNNIKRIQQEDVRHNQW